MSEIESEYQKHEKTTEERPMLLRDIVAVTLDTGILIDGLGREEIIRGTLAQTILPELLRLMNGTRTLRQLQNLLPTIPPGYVEIAVRLLTSWGLTEHADETPDLLFSNKNTIAFLKRYIAASGFDCSASSAYINLRKAEVFVVGANEAASQKEILRSLLEATGVGAVIAITREQFLTISPPKSSLIVSLIRGEEDAGWCTQIDERRSDLHFSWLRVTISKDRALADVGPLFRPGSGTCYECFHNVHAQYNNSTPGQPLTLDEEKIWASIVALEVTNILAFPSFVFSGRQFRRFTFPIWSSRYLNYPSLPGCRRCRKEEFHFSNRQGMGINAEYVTDTALVFEEYVGLESRASLSANARQDFAHINHALSREAKRLQNCKQIQLYRGDLELNLGALDSMRINNASVGGELTLDKLAAILAVTAGIREISDDVVRRWPATAGNLGSVELYIASRSIRGLDSGFYFYQPHEHSLASLRKPMSIEVSEFMRRVLRRSTTDDLPDAIILFTGAFHRLARKYGSFALRLMNLDAGSALSQLHMVSSGMNLYTRTERSSADDLIQEQFNLSPTGEYPTAVVEISCARRKETRTRSLFNRHLPMPITLSSWKSARDFAGMDLQEVTAMLLKESCGLEADTQVVNQQIPQVLLSEGAPKHLAVKFSKFLNGKLSIGEVLTKRRSIRKYSRHPVSANEIGTVLHYAHSMDIAEWPHEHNLGMSLNFLVLAKNIQGVKPGVYKYDGSEHGLYEARSVLSHDETVDLLVQSELADAPVLVWITGNLAIACAHNGARGHRQLLLRAGAAGHRLWMTALGIGLSGCIFAGVVPGAARRILEMDGYKMASLFVFATGHESYDSQSEIDAEHFISR